jgi:hypothetical protein
VICLTIYSKLCPPLPNIVPPVQILVAVSVQIMNKISALDAHADDRLFLSSHYHHLTFEQRADLLYVHWDTLHAFQSVLEIKTWLESLSQSDHLLLIQLHGGTCSLDVKIKKFNK